MAGVQDLARLMGLAALLLSFALVAGRRGQAVAGAAQGAAIGLAALCQAMLQADWALAAVALVLAGQGWFMWVNRPSHPDRSAFPIATLCLALLLVVLATASAPSERMGVPLAIVLLGLLAAAAMPGPYGVVSLLNGVILGMVVTPGFPLRLVTVVALAALACVVVRGDGRVVGVRR